MEQHPVPQHIGSFEFKLFGPLTIRQFVTLAIPMSIATLIFFSPLPSLIRLTLTGVIGFFAVFAALVPIQGRPFDKWVVAFIKAITSPTQRVWIKEKRLPSFLNVVISPHTAPRFVPEKFTSQNRQRLKEYLRSLPSDNKTPLDAREQMALERLDLDYSKTSEGKLPPPIIWSQPKKSLENEEISFSPISFPQIGQAGTSPSYKETAAPRISHFAKPYALNGLEKKLSPKQAIEILPQIKTRLASEANFTIENVIPIQTPDKKIKLIHGIGKTRARKLHYAPPAGFDLSKLPIRGERRFEVSEELKKRFGFEQEPEIEQVNTRPAVQPHRQEEPQIQKNKPANVSPGELPSIRASAAKGVIAAQDASGINQLLPVVDTANIISGIVIDEGENPIQNVILTIKDKSGIPVRALKTNKLGQFISATPLGNGEYTIEAESENKTFKPRSITLSGEVINPMKIFPEGDKN